MKKYFILTLFVIGICRTYSQIPIVDALTNERIPFVEIYTLNGDIIGITNVEGVIGKKLLENIKKTDTVSLNHLSYIENVLAVNDLISLQQIKLSPEKNLLQEVTLVGKKRRIKAVAKLKGYYRSYEINNDELKYYADGIVEYFVPLNLKNKIWNSRIQERSFANKKLEKEEKQRPTMLTYEMAGIPYLNQHYTKSFLEEKGHEFRKKGTNTYNILFNNSKEGILVNDPERKTTSLHIQLISEDRAKERRMFGYTTVLANHMIYTVYNTNFLDSLNHSQLVYFKGIRKLRFKHKRDKAYQQLKGVSEFFVTEIEILSEFKKSLHSKWFGFNRKSDYVTEYWEEFKKHPFYKPLPSGVEWALKNKLTELENTQEISKIYLDLGLIIEE